MQAVHARKKDKRLEASDKQYYTNRKSIFHYSEVDQKREKCLSVCHYYLESIELS